MNDYIFENGMDRLTKWYCKKLDVDQRDMWFELIGHIPDGPFQEIINLCITGEKFFPTPQAIKDMYQFWLQAILHKPIKVRKNSVMSVTRLAG